MEPLITITLSDYNKLKEQIEVKTQKEHDIELVLYWAYRIIEGNPDIKEELTMQLAQPNIGLTVERRGTRILVIKL